MGPLQPDLTDDQATDLARYFLGPGWKAFRLQGGIRPYWLQSPIDSLDSVYSYQDTSWRDVFRTAGVQLPARSRYTAHGTSVMMEDRPICTAVSNTLAKRIAAALNEHTPDRRGI